MVEDAQPSLSFFMDLKQQRQALMECNQCQTLEDYMAFTRKWLGVGSVQIPEEIGGALSYLSLNSPRRVCEIGTEDGGTTFLLSHMLPDIELLVGVDLYIQNRTRLERLHRAGHRLILINGSSIVDSTVKHVENILEGAQLDVLFIDGDHRYEGVKKDFLLYRHLVRNSGLVLFHDIVQDHRVRFGKETLAFSGGVPVLWNELKQIYPFQEFIQDSDQNGMGIGVIRYSPDIELPSWFVRN
jgi:cephalosporin hydroxylase